MGISSKFMDMIMRVVNNVRTETKNLEDINNNLRNETKNLEDIVGTKEILCDGYFYDITDFINKHPGGRVIYYYTKTGEDATHAIQQFHQPSIKRVRAMMSSFKKRPASDNESNSHIKGIFNI